ncbi:hypothetical protein FOL01_1142 [Weissella jogaejeotgali]|uniref:Uncharacterized protein n=1 Tax=Weissella jogaejeotgali TaxID=1631871 RepID=A0A1L6RBS9_9LACO|nr:hypothetical protein [Weissella jogaejeotgali]APS42001.1 hypothetical protein FOL01_1142 [Weissella jogaejeotgali]
MVVGIPEERVQAATNDELLKQTLKSSFKSKLTNESLQFLSELDTPVKKQVIDKKFKLKFPNPGMLFTQNFIYLAMTQPKRPA